MGEVRRRWPGATHARWTPSVEAREEFRAFHDRVTNDDLPRFEDEFKRQLNTNTIRELAEFNNWLGRQAEEIHERVARINEALGAIDYNPGRYIQLVDGADRQHEVQDFRADLRDATDDAARGRRRPLLRAAVPRRQAHHRAVPRPRGHAESDRPGRAGSPTCATGSSSPPPSVTARPTRSGSTTATPTASPAARRRSSPTRSSPLRWPTSSAWSGAPTKSRDFRFAVIDEAFGRGSDVSTRYALELFAKLGLQLLIVTPLQKVHVIEPYVQRDRLRRQPDRQLLAAADDDDRGVPRASRHGRQPMSAPGRTPADIAAKVRRRWDDGSLLRAFAAGEPFPADRGACCGDRRPAEIGDAWVRCGLGRPP